MSNLAVQLGRLSLRNPILVASGTFGYAKEMESFVDFSKIGGVIPKTVTPLPRAGNPPPRTVETSAGLLNSIGLDNDGLDTFIEKHIPYLTSLDTALIVNIAGKNEDEFMQMAERLNEFDGIAALELNISCPNVSGGVDYGTDPTKAEAVVKAVVQSSRFPVIAKLTPNVTSVPTIATAAKEGGADAVSLINTFQGMAINWRNRKPILGNGIGGLSGPAIKPLALRIVWQVAQAVDIPIIGIGGIQSIDDVMEFLVAGATAIQVGTANFYKPGLSGELVEQLEQTLVEQQLTDVKEVVGSIQFGK
ncbi:dihydroorotate dehydrogenase [Calycomorphotria hydatis]|uniref:Dihydroorotate dehydrogenase n=1 Tax=Calycomorphotria hydatis TaxID=2528027 RepID=A0A517T756_9PLAN|nr:dihydroorotate dehydrogenase [Calycomorphotria hydatis]QDT64208.1 Dihydroorotate dehydrogenase B (NAD(+)), catalytic subunit [Calycomorphotria hydatis]